MIVLEAIAGSCVLALAILVPLIVADMRRLNREHAERAKADRATRPRVPSPNHQPPTRP